MDKPLIGNEFNLIKRFKCSLSISDEEAAAVHIDIGRRINRLRSEAGCRTDSARITKFLHRFIYVSTMVFGDTAYLLNWKRHLGISDAQLLVAKRNCATQLFKDKLSAYGEAGPHPYEEDFKELWSYAKKNKAAKETAEKMINDAIKAAVVTKLTEAITENDFHIQNNTSTQSSLKTSSYGCGPASP
jgi:hypothetical protein